VHPEHHPALPGDGYTGRDLQGEPKTGHGSVNQHALGRLLVAKALVKTRDTIPGIHTPRAQV